MCTRNTPSVILYDAGCSYARGMCGKTSEHQDLQDMLVHLLQAVATYAVAARKVGVVDAEIDAYVPQAFFSTLTNVNFDADRIIDFSPPRRGLPQ